MSDDQNAVGFDQLQDADLVVGWIYHGGTAPNVGSEPINKLLPGSGNQGGFRAIGSTSRDDVKAVVLFTTGKEIGWPDALDAETGLFAYFGDNRKPGRALEDTPRGGNRLLRQVFARAHSAPADRAKVPPFLLFDKPGRGRDVRFRGLLAPGGAQIAGDADLATVSSSEGGQTFQNYQAHFTLLNVPVVPRGWIDQVLAGDPLGSECPAEWRAWVESQRYAPLIGSPPLDDGTADDEAQDSEDPRTGRLSDITGDSVLKAIAEYGELGQEEFLARYGFESARSYLLVHEGKTYDSKAIVGAAHGFLPGQQPLAARDFSGGEATVGRLLRRLGFVVQVGEQTPSGVIKLLTKLNVYYADGLPALYQPITLLWAMSRAKRREPRLATWDETVEEISELVECYGRPNETPRVYYPVAALYQADLWDIDAGSAIVPNAHGSSVPQGWFEDHRPRNGLVASVYELMRDSASVRRAAANALVDKYFVDAPYAPLLTALGLDDSPIEQAFNDEAEYRRLCGRADAFWQERSDKRAPQTSNDPIRSKAARRAVILRSKGKCESPDCTSGDIQDVTDKGEPLLEVDHVQDLALDGDDSPVQMIALCPNCHKMKTSGRNREQLRQKLLVVAERLHNEKLAES